MRAWPARGLAQRTGASCSAAVGCPTRRLEQVPGDAMTRPPLDPPVAALAIDTAPESERATTRRWYRWGRASAAGPGGKSVV
jgi:hypothetical protein